MSSRIVKIVLFDKQINTVMVNGKGFLEVIVSEEDIKNVQRSRGAPLSGTLTGFSSSTASLGLPEPTEEDKLEADRIAVGKKLSELLTPKDATLRYVPEIKKFGYLGLTEADKSRFVHVITYVLSDEEKNTIRSKSTPGFSFVFTPFSAFPVGLTGIEAGIAYSLTRNYDYIKDRLFFNVPSLYLPSRVPIFNPIGAFPLFSPYSLPPVVDYRNRYNSYRPENIFDAPPIPRSHSRGRSLGRSPRSSSRSSRSSRGSRMARRSASPNSKRRYREKYLKYKMKYIQLKQMMGEE
jgi:hypothetical protein